jgi:hypothetical protein
LLSESFGVANLKRWKPAGGQNPSSYAAEEQSRSNQWPAVLLCDDGTQSESRAHFADSA